VVNADHILVLEAGRLVEEGTHLELTANPHGVYARFHRPQSGNGLELMDDTAQAQPQTKQEKPARPARRKTA
jgi:ATP-binding cassette subfamily B protein